MMVAALAGSSSKVCVKHYAFSPSNACQAIHATQPADLMQLHCPAWSKPDFGWQLSDIGIISMCFLPQATSM